MNPDPVSSRPTLEAIRAKLKRLRGRQFWLGLEEIVETSEFQEVLNKKFHGREDWRDGVGRREFLKLMASSLALAGLTACTKQPIHEIVPYVSQPELIVTGTPLEFATAMPMNGFGLGLLVKSYEGHPVKIEGNPRHPISLGATNVFMQAALLDLYDPDRSEPLLQGDNVSNWSRFSTVLQQAMLEQKSKAGAGLRILTETITSPTLISQILSLLEQFPKARWDRYQPIGLDQVHGGAQLAFGERVETHYRFHEAEVVLALDSDFLFTHPAGLRHAREFTDARRVSSGRASMNRLYCVESAPSITGSMAEHRLAIRPSEVESVAREVLQSMGLENAGRAVPPDRAKWIIALVKDLQQHRGSSIVIPGEWQPPAVHALAHAINQALGNFGKTVFFTSTVEPHPTDQLESLRRLTNELQSGQVDVFIVLGGNPVFTAPADLEFGNAVQKAPLSIHLGTHRDETSNLCGWHIPQAHFLESWSDVRAFDGTISIIQPLIAPLYRGISDHEFISSMTNLPPLPGYEIIREYWKKRNLWPDFESSWRKALHDGLIERTHLPFKQMQVQAIPPASGALPSGLEISFRPDPTIWDGRFANNGWLQELAKPITKITWDNAALMSPKLAADSHLSNGDVIELRFQGRSLQIPVWVTAGHADGCVTLFLGNGRHKSGSVGTGIGWDAYSLRTSNAMWSGSGLEFSHTARTHEFAATQLYRAQPDEERQVIRAGTLAQFKADPQFIQKDIKIPPVHDTLYNPGEHDYAGYRWAMAIDLTTCIGCNACVLGCQSENNIPVVGQTEVRRGRAMQWIRIDTYFSGNLENPEMHHMPVPCMHCEYAPCELVCPVEATLHDHEGLNIQVYNRCVGTRFCSNNCPYKVRRFNFFKYQDHQTDVYKPMRNPQVTVRWRGVMEKCTYCIQRISVARITAKKENRRIRDGELRPACEQACPTSAIIFGDLGDPQSRVSKLRKNPLMFPMLGDLNTQPRTTYLSKISNPNSAVNNRSE